MLTQGAVDACTEIRMLYYHTARIFSLVDFTDPNNAGKDTRRLYFPWDLDAVFRSTTGSIYASVSGRKVAPSTYQEVIRRYPTFRAKYNQIMLNLVNSPLSVANVQAFLTQAEAVISSALANDPFPTTDSSPVDEFNRLRVWVAARDVNVRSTNLEWATQARGLSRRL
jgi:hypothetical protein